MKQKSCPGCSATLRPFALSCDACGMLFSPISDARDIPVKPEPPPAPMQALKPTATPQQRAARKRRTEFAIIGLVLAIAAAIMGWLIVRTFRGTNPDEMRVMLGVNILASNVPAIIAAAVVITPLLRFLPWERGRPWRVGFFLVAPIVALLSVVVLVVGGSVSFWAIMLGPWEGQDRAVGPWLTMLPALAMAPPLGVGAGVATAAAGGSLLRLV